MRKRVVVNQKEWLHNNIRRHDPIIGAGDSAVLFSIRQEDKRRVGVCGGLCYY